MKKAFTLLLLLIITIAFLASDRHDKGDSIDPPKSYPLVVDSKKMEANTINTWFRNNGSFNRDPATGNSGFEWPKFSKKFARYASGLWLGAKVGANQDTLVAMAEYDYEYLPGFTDNSGVPQGKDDPLYRVYKLTRNVQDLDRAEWPNALLGNSDQNAPVFFDSASQSWKPLELGYQTLYYVYTDSYPEAHGNNGGSTDPLKVDIQQTNFAFNFGGALGQIAFTQLLIINKSTEPWIDTYLAAWSDDDLGESTDDMVAVDVPIGLGYTYNGDNNDGQYGAAPPAVGFDFFRGAIEHTNDPNDTAYVCVGKERQTLVGYKQRGLNVFNWYTNGGQLWGDPQSFRETYRILTGRGKLGQAIVDPNGDTTTYFYNGDPVTGTGWISGPMAPEDQRFLQCTGPFTMNPGDTQIIVVGQVIARGTSNLNSITQLRATDVKAQTIYDNCFNVPAPPPPPKTTAYAPGNGKIYLTWNDEAEKVREFNVYNNSFYYFQGYNIYAVRPGTDGSDPNDRLLLATFDLKDTIGDIYDSIEVAQYNAIVYALVQKGTNSGVQRTLVIDKDPFTGNPLINGTPYCFSVTAYSFDVNSGWSVGTPKWNESSVAANVTCVTPQALAQGTIVHYDFGDTINTNQHDLGLLPLVVDPLIIQTAEYKTVITSYNNQMAWDLYKNGNMVVQANYNFAMTQDTALVYDGIMFIHRIQKDSGVVRDANDPAAVTSDINTNERGWEYSPPQNQWVQGPDTGAVRTAKFFPGRHFQSRSMGLSHPNTSTVKGQRTKIVANGPYFYPDPNPTNMVLNGGPLRKVNIIFGQTSKAFRFVPTDTSGGLTNIPFNNLVDIPFSAYEVDDQDSTGDPRQLNVGFIDFDLDGTWNPDTTKLGNYQITVIFASSYDENSTAYNLKNLGSNSPSQGFPSTDIMYVWAPRAMKGPNGEKLTWTANDTLKIFPYIITRPEFVPGTHIYYAFNTIGSQIGNIGFATDNQQMERVNVFPNPYFGHNRLESTPVNRFVTFTNLPSTCTIYIYSLNGILLRKLNRDNTDPKNSSERWDLRNDSDIPVASGMYIAVIDAPGNGTKVLKMAVFTPEERIDTY